MSRYILLAENGNLPRNNAPRLSTVSPGMTSTARGAYGALVYLYRQRKSLAVHLWARFE